MKSPFQTRAEKWEKCEIDLETLTLVYSMRADIEGRASLVLTSVGTCKQGNSIFQSVQAYKRARVRVSEEANTGQRMMRMYCILCSLLMSRLTSTMLPGMRSSIYGEQPISLNFKESSCLTLICGILILYRWTF